MTKTIRRHLDWDSEVSLTDVFDSGTARHYPHRLANNLLYLSSVPNYSSGKLRTVLCLASLDDETGSVLDITPEPFDLRSDIHEYGGKPFWVFGNTVIFTNSVDRCLYRCYVLDKTMTSPKRVSSADQILDYQIGTQPIRRLSQQISFVCYSDVNLINSNVAIAIAEVHFADGAEPAAMIVAIDLSDVDAPLTVLQSGADFYANLVFGQDDATYLIAWVEWQHPFMPWDRNTVRTALLHVGQGGCLLRVVRTLPNQRSGSFCQLVFSASAQLYCVADFVTPEGLTPEDDLSQTDDKNANYWNVYRVDLTSLELSQLTAIEKEFGYPHWQFGDCRLSAHGGRFIVGISADPVADALWIYDTETKQDRFIESSGTLQHLSINAQGQGAVIELPIDSASRIIVFSLSDDGHVMTSKAHDDTELSDSLALPQRKPQFAVSRAQHIEFPTGDGSSAFAFYYAPTNAKFDCTDPPPAIVMVHGGPTARAYGYFDLQKQFWTSNGFAVVDVNHRGSSGYGRRYRDALYGQWGELDCSDIIDAIDHLIERQWVDARAVCIRGKSAGGYAVLRALTQYPTRFAAGASYYGIGDLALLAEITHKFEKHYTDRLLGEVYDVNLAKQPNSLYQTRSPINKLKGLKTPMAVFQGALDNVVPVKLAHELVNALESGGIQYQYYEYADEAHGFKNPKNNRAAWAAELAFYRETLRPIMFDN